MDEYSKKVLIVDDEKRISDIVSFNLKKEGYEVCVAFDGEKGLELALSEKPDLILLDIMMPKMDGFVVCRKIREKSQVPIIMLTARVEEFDRVLGLELGADDYVCKPFSNRELMARVKANIRRNSPYPEEKQTDEKSIISFGNISIDTEKFELRKNDEIVELTPREFDLIKFLALAKSQVFSRETLLEKVWNYDYYGDVRTVDVTISRLRTKIEDNPDKPTIIITKRGYGYSFGG